MKKYAPVVCALIALCTLLVVPGTAVGQDDPTSDPTMDIPPPAPPEEPADTVETSDLPMEVPPPEPPEDPVDAIDATNRYLDEAMFMGEAEQICAEYRQTNPPLEPEGIDRAMLSFFSRVLADVSGEEVDLESDPRAVASMRSFLITGLDCENGRYFFDLGEYYAFDDAELENVEPPDAAFIEELRQRFFPSGMAPEEGLPGEGGGVPAGGGGGRNELADCCIPMSQAEPQGGHPFVVECPPRSVGLTPAPYGNVVPDVNRCWNGSFLPVWADECAKNTPGAADLIGLAYVCQAGKVAQIQQEIRVGEQMQSLGQAQYMLKPLLFGALSGLAFAVTAPATAGGVLVAGAIAVATSYAGTEGYSATLYGNAATSMVEGGNPLNPVSFVVPTLEKLYDAATGSARDEALKMIGENAELVEMAKNDLLRERGKLKDLEQKFKQSGGKRPKLTDTACNNMDAWRWKQ